MGIYNGAWCDVETVAEAMPLDTTKAIILPPKEGLKTTDSDSLPLVFLTAYTAVVY